MRVIIILLEIERAFSHDCFMCCWDHPSCYLHTCNAVLKGLERCSLAIKYHCIRFQSVETCIIFVGENSRTSISLEVIEAKGEEYSRN